MEKIAYIVLGITALTWLVLLIVGLISAFPLGITGLVAIVGLGLLFIKALGDRLKSVKTDQYSKEVHK